MPITNTPDKFFLSNFNFQVLRELQLEMLKEMMALNPIQNGLFDKNALIRFARIKTIHAAIKSENIFTQSIFNDKLKDIQTRMKIDNENLQAELKANIELQNTLKDSIRELYIDYINEAFNNHRVALGDHRDAERKYTFTIKNPIINKTPIIQSKGFPNFSSPTSHNYSNEIDTYINSGAVAPFKQKTENGTNVDFKTEKGTPIYNGWSVKTKQGYIPDPMKNLTKSRDYYEAVTPLINSFYANELEAPPGAFRFFIEKLHGSYSDFKGYAKRGVTSSKTPGFKHNLSNRTVFAAFIDDVQQNYSASHSGVQLLGSSEDFNIYQKTTRTISLSFSIISDYSLELLLALQEIYKLQKIDKDLSKEITRIKQLSYYDKGLGFFGMPGTNGDVGGTNMYADTPETLWKKVTFLQQCMYPYYRMDGKLKEMPMMRLRLGDYLDVNGFFTSLSIDTNSFDNIMDLNPSNLGVMPFAVKVTIAMTVVHDWLPSSNFFGFWHRKEFDIKEANRQTGEGLYMNKTNFGDANIRFEDGVEEKDSKGTVPEKQLEQSKGGNVAGGETDPQLLLQSELGMSEGELFQLMNQQKIDIASGKKVDNEQETKKKIKLVERISRINDKLKELYGYTSDPIKSQKGVKGLKAKYQQELDNFNKLKNEVTLLYGGIQANLNAVNDKLRLADRALNKVGINVKAADEVSDVIKKVNALKLRNLIPKKLNDIL